MAPYTEQKETEKMCSNGITVLVWRFSVCPKCQNKISLKYAGGSK